MANILFVIVSFNAKRYMQECIQSIRSKIKPGTYKIVVVDNASTDGIAQWLTTQDDILLIRNETNIGFGPGCNQAVLATNGTEYQDFDVFLLNNDTIMTATAVPRMIETLYSADDIGAVGCMSSYAGNRQEYSVAFKTTEEYIRFGESLNIPQKDSILERVRLNGFAMLIRRKIWDAIGGFDEDFAPGYYEDDALSIEILKRGYRLLLQRGSFIYHVGSASFVKSGTNKLSEDHHSLFIKKYNFDILDYVYPCGAIMSQIPFQRDASFNVLHLGCGLGAELKAIHSFYPSACCYGIEPDTTLLEIASKTESVFSDVSTAAKEIPHSSIDLLIIDSNYLPRVSEETKSLLLKLCSKNAFELNRLHTYDNYNFNKIILVVWDDDLYSSEVSRFLSEYGIVNICTSEFEKKELIKATGLDNDHILSITPDNSSIVPYLTAHFGRLNKDSNKSKRVEVVYSFLKRFGKQEPHVTNNSSEGFKPQILFHNNCDDHLNEIKGLIEESNLIYDSHIPSDENSIERLYFNDWNYCEYITASDEFGDYGIVGFYCYNLREQKMKCLVLSWMAKVLGINQAIDKRIKTHIFSHRSYNTNKIRVLIKCDSYLSTIEKYLIGGNITTEYWDCIEKNSCLEDDQPSLIYDAPFHIIIFSLLQNDINSWEKDADNCLAKMFDELDNIYTSVIGTPTIILLTGSEKCFDSSNSRSKHMSSLYQELNPIIEDYAADHDRIRVINITEFINEPSDFCGDINHFGVRVFSDIAERICLYINEKVDEILKSS